MINKVNGQAFAYAEVKTPANSARGNFQEIYQKHLLKAQDNYAKAKTRDSSASIDLSSNSLPQSVSKESAWNILERIQDDAAAITAGTKEQSVAQRIDFIQKELETLAAKDSSFSFERVDAVGKTYFRATVGDMRRSISPETGYSISNIDSSVKLQREKFQEQMAKFLEDHPDYKMSVGTGENGMKTYRFFTEKQTGEGVQITQICTFDEEFFVKNDLVGKSEVEIKQKILQLFGSPESLSPSEFFDFVDAFNKVGLPLKNVPYFKKVNDDENCRLYNMSDLGSLRKMMPDVDFFGENVMESIKSYSARVNWIDMFIALATDADQAYAMGWNTYNGDGLRGVAATLSDLVKLMTKKADESRQRVFD